MQSNLLLMQAICKVPVSPMRAGSSHRTEMVSQLLFGELIEILESNEDWVRIKSVADNYEGWCQPAHIMEVNENLVVNAPVYASDWINPVLVNEEIMWVPYGSRIDLVVQPPLKAEFFYRGNRLHPVELTGSILLEYAMKYINTTYLWGGRSVFGVDCSGLSQQVHRMAGILIPRDAWQQAAHGEVINVLEEAKPGDLAFFDNEEGKIIHVGILVNEQAIIHSSGMVRIDVIDTQGIIHSETGKRTHKLHSIRRFL
jgi:hypothetical protein